MSTRSSARNLLPPLDNPELTIRRRSRIDPTLLNDFEMATEGNGDPPVSDLRTMKELCQPSLNGRNSCQFLRLTGDDANKHLDKFLHVTQSMKVNGVTDDALRLTRVDPNLLNNFNMATNGNGDDVPPAGGATVGQTQNVYAAGAYNHGGNSYQPQGNRNLLSYRSDNYLGQPGFYQNQNRSNQNQNYQNRNQGNNHGNVQGNNQGRNQFFQGASHGQNPPPAYQVSAYPPKVVERKTEVTKDTVPPTNNRSTKDVQPLVVQVETQVLNSEPVVEPVKAPVSASKPNPKPSIPYPSRLHDQKLPDKTNDQKEKFFQIFKDLNFNISFADALILMPMFGLTIKSLLTNKEKLFELAKTPLNEHCSMVLLKKLRDPGKFLIPCDFLRMDECLALANLGASINLMPLSTERALIDVYEDELTLRVGNKAVTFNLDQTSRHSSNYDDILVNRIDIIDVACEEYSQEVLGFSVSGNPTPYMKLIVFTSSPALTPFGDIDFLLQEIDAFLATDDELISPEIDDSYYDLEGDILLLEEFLNDYPSSQPLPPKELKGNDKLPVIIAKDLKDEEKIALIKVLKSHKQALAWKLSDIKGINQEFCTHKILIEDEIKPAVQYQGRVNPKIHEVIKKEVLKLLDARLIYPISESPWVSPVHCVPKKGGFTIVENEENELNPTRLVTGWHVCIDYRKLNDATHKDHFPLPFMDQMLEILAGNEYYYFLDGFSGYFQIPIDLQD
uniref:Reverse transcriptase domain-containing protein n=1 Tax=Tanacetum cinerariifolium TaxID=118510 RepID=A0A6L2KI22_TANCI|nr:reverse transcriptase domain-containing protein [Tanacetum cinerariifolium]